MTEWIKGSEGRSFVIGGTAIFVGPRDKLPNDRHLRKPPVLAFARPGDKAPTIVTEFPNSTAAEKFIDAFAKGLDEATAKPIKPKKKES